MQFEKGQQIGGYEIIAPIGKGGMGEVYRARDAKISRDVAIKVLPESFAQDADRMDRFHREARAAGAINHPNLVTVYEVGEDGGTPYLVMELLEGESLRERLSAITPRVSTDDDQSSGAQLSPRRAVEIGSQIAKGLAAAHDRGIIHRDLKPDNVFVTRDGIVKVLDFGLAKLTGRAEEDLTDAETMHRETSPGVMLGTVGYMSPEQVRGQPVDHRTDIFAFGAILYEMLSGRRAFSGATSADTITAILREDPPELLEVAPTVSPALDRIVRHCLEKSPERRFQSARDLAFDLEAHTLSGASGSGIAVAPEEEGIGTPAKLVLAGLAIAVVAGLIGVWIGSRGRASAPSETATARVFRQVTYDSGVELFPSISPDGRNVVYTAAGPGGDLDLFLQRVGGRAAINLTELSDANESQPTFSPDGTQIAFRSERSGGGIFVMGATGESVRRVSDFGFNPAWSPNGTRLVVAEEPTWITPESRNTESSLWILDVRTGERRLLLEKDGMQPSWSPNGERIAYWGIVGGSGVRDLWTISATADDPASTIVPVTGDAELDWNPVWSPEGDALFFGSDRDGTRNLWRISVDQTTGSVTGEPRQVGVPGRWAGHFSIAAETGGIAFMLLDRAMEIRKAALDRATGETGESELVFGGTLMSHSWSASPDGEWIALSIMGDTQDILLVRTDGTELRQLTNDAALDRGPSFSADGSEIYFYTTRNDTNYDVWKIGTDGSGLTRVTDTDAQSHWYPVVSPDRSRLLTQNDRGTYTADLSAGIPVRDLRELPPFPDESLLFAGLSWSPDGRQIVGELEKSETGVGGHGIALFSFEDQSYQILAEEGGAAAFLGTGEVLARNQDGLFLIDPATGRRTRIDIEAGQNVRNSRDGRFIFNETRSMEADIWMLEQSESAPPEVAD